ncbi:MAG TPA: flavin reductase family protein [Candidatus Bathyarchaeia archaeon]|nr:flavin reductase family protein [Candidatus Bathyarchaeia archaeon]
MQTVTPKEAAVLSAPMIYSLVTSLDVNGKPNVLGVSWVTRTSFDPFLLMISIDHSRYSHAGIDFHKEFVVHYPSAEQAGAAWFCGTRSGRDTDKIKETGLSLVDSVAVHVPTIEGATVAFECKVVGQFETGDHTVFVGEVIATRGEPQKMEHLYVTANYEFFGLDGSRVPDH